MKNELPARPSLEQLKKQAKDLLKSRPTQQANSIARIREALPFLKGKSDQEILAADFDLHDAQSVIAREYGFGSWLKLREEVERRLLRWEDRSKHFVLEALKDKGQRARDFLKEDLSLAGSTFWCSLVAGQTEQIRKFLEKDPGLVSKKGGPRPELVPLHYVAFSRLQMDDDSSKKRFTECARILLEAGADINAAWEHESWPGCPLRSLYGACGENNNPHLTRFLLEQGAMINDGESIYHAAEHYHLECLEILQEFGASLGKDPHWGNTPLFFLMGYTPNHKDWPLAVKGMEWLLEHGSDPNIACGHDHETSLHVAIRCGQPATLVSHLIKSGADINATRKDGKTPLAIALLNGSKEHARLLIEAGAIQAPMTTVERFFSAIFAGDEKGAFALKAEIPGYPQSLSEEDRLALKRASEQGNLPAMRLLLKEGFDITYKGNQPWGNTPLHSAAWHGEHEAVKLLLENGAPVDIRANKPEDSFPMEWAAHGSESCRNPKGDYVAIVNALMDKGGVPTEAQASMASPEVAEAIRIRLPSAGSGTKR